MARREAIIRLLAAADLPDGSREERLEAATELVNGWVEQGLLPDEDHEAEVERLRQRVHDVAAECERRFAPYVSRCEKFDIWSGWARDHFQQAGDTTWSHGSEANRLLILSLIEETDRARAEAKALKIEKYTELLNWLCEGDHYALMNAYHPDLMVRLRRALRSPVRRVS